MRTPGGFARILLVVLLIFGVLQAQTSSFSADNLHHHPSEHCCALCHAGPMPLVRPAPAVATAPMLPLARVEPAPESDAPRDEPVRATHSRAPPA